MTNRIAWGLLTAWMTLGVAAGCGRSQVDGRVEEANLPRAPEASWSFKFRSECNDPAARDCIARFGLSIESTGDYEVGPAPDGQRLSGKVDPEDLVRLGALASKASSKRLCLGRTELKGEGALSCGDLGASDPEGDVPLAGDLRASLASETHRLVEKYYPARFPNDCSASLLALQSLHTKVSKCDRDEDCSWLDGAYVPIDLGQTRRSSADSCGFVGDLEFANTFQVVVEQSSLLRKREVARVACSSLPAPYCATSGSPIRVASSVPGCIHHFCQAH